MDELDGRSGGQRASAGSPMCDQGRGSSRSGRRTVGVLLILATGIPPVACRGTGEERSETAAVATATASSSTPPEQPRPRLPPEPPAPVAESAASC